MNTPTTVYYLTKFNLVLRLSWNSLSHTLWGRHITNWAYNRAKGAQAGSQQQSDFREKYDLLVASGMKRREILNKEINAFLLKECNPDKAGWVSRLLKKSWLNQDKGRMNLLVYQLLDIWVEDQAVERTPVEAHAIVSHMGQLVATSADPMLLCDTYLDALERTRASSYPLDGMDLIGAVQKYDASCWSNGDTSIGNLYDQTRRVSERTHQEMQERVKNMIDLYEVKKVVANTQEVLLSQGVDIKREVIRL